MMFLCTKCILVHRKLYTKLFKSTYSIILQLECSYEKPLKCQFLSVKMSNISLHNFSSFFINHITHSKFAKSRTSFEELNTIMNGWVLFWIPTTFSQVHLLVRKDSHTIILSPANRSVPNDVNQLLMFGRWFLIYNLIVSSDHAGSNSAMLTILLLVFPIDFLEPFLLFVIGITFFRPSVCWSVFVVERAGLTRVMLTLHKELMLT